MNENVYDLTSSLMFRANVTIDVLSCQLRKSSPLNELILFENAAFLLQTNTYQ